MGAPISNPNSFTQWQKLSPLGVGTGGDVPYGAQGGNPPIHYHDIMDARRSGAYGAAEPYPDGYLNSTHDRREDRLEESGTQTYQPREAQRAFARGVHKGERIPPENYYWPQELSLDSGIRRQAMFGTRFSGVGKYVEAYSPGRWSLENVQSGNVD